MPFVPKSESLAALTAGLHIVFERVLALSIFLHVAGALKHHFIDRDDTLRRMWFGQTEASGGGTHHVAAPLGTALLAWIAAIGIGAAMGVYQSHETPQTQIALEEVSSDWAVSEGSLEITVGQLGSDVVGVFNEWTAAITFDETIQTQKQGEVTVTIAIPSLTLGSVTGQAMGPDFFNADAFPTATFSADILQATDGYVAQGTLTLRGVSVPVTLPFNLTLDGDTAHVDGTLSLDRRDFNIGDNMADETTVVFAVGVSVTLTATRQP